MGGEFCACLKISYTPVDYPGGAKGERWTCDSCGCEFTRLARAERAEDRLSTAHAEGYREGLEAAREELRAQLYRESNTTHHVPTWETIERTLKEAVSRIDTLLATTKGGK